MISDGVHLVQYLNTSEVFLDPVHFISHPLSRLLEHVLKLLVDLELFLLQKGDIVENRINDHLCLALHLIYSLLGHLINCFYLHLHLLFTSILLIFEVIYYLEHVFQLLFDLIISSDITIIIS